MIKTIVAVSALFVALVVAVNVGVMLLLNSVVIERTGWVPFSFWDALGLTVLAGLLFGSRYVSKD